MKIAQIQMHVSADKAENIRHACDLLKKSTLPVGEIGQRVGYPDYFYFAKVFKKAVGGAPTEYRKAAVG